MVTCSFSFYNADSSLGSPTDTSSAAYLMSEQFQQLALLGVNVFLISQDEGSDAGIRTGRRMLSTREANRGPPAAAVL